VALNANPAVPGLLPARQTIASFLQEVRTILRLKHSGIRTQEMYRHRSRQFIPFHDKKHPQKMGVDQIRAYLCHLAVQGNVGRAVAERVGYCCESCSSQEELSHDGFSVEHVTPRARGGGDDLDNLAFSCQGCNSRKFIAPKATDPVTGEPAPRLVNLRRALRARDVSDAVIATTVLALWGLKDVAQRVVPGPQRVLLW
jgi:5-methylcytosine-specific restriction endonuclease McrA